MTVRMCLAAAPVRPRIVVGSQVPPALDSLPPRGGRRSPVGICGPERARSLPLRGKLAGHPCARCADQEQNP